MALIGSSTSCRMPMSRARASIQVYGHSRYSPSLPRKSHASVATSDSRNSPLSNLKRNTARILAGGLIMVALSNGDIKVEAQEFESAIIDGSAPLSQVEQYEELLKIAGKMPEVEVKEEKSKFVPKELQKKEPLSEKKTESKSRVSEVAKKKSSPPPKAKKESSEGSGFPLPAIAAVIAAGAGFYYFTSSGDKASEATTTKKTPVAAPAAPAAPPAPVASTPPTTSDKLPNSVEAAQWIATWRAKQAA